MLCTVSSLKSLCQGQWKTLILKSTQATVKKSTDFFLCFNPFTLFNIPEVPAFNPEKTTPLLLALVPQGQQLQNPSELTHKQEALFSQTGIIPLRSELHRLPGVPSMQLMGQLGLLRFKKKLLQFSLTPFQLDSKLSYVVKAQLHHPGVPPALPGLPTTTPGAFTTFQLLSITPKQEYTQKDHEHTQRRSCRLPTRVQGGPTEMHRLLPPAFRSSEKPGNSSKAS